MFSLEQQRVLLIGGSSGIGLATAMSAVAAGAAVTIASRSQDKLDTAAARIAGSVETATLDTSDNAAIEAFFANHAPWDHIVISAAQTPTGPVRELPLDQAHAALESKFWGTYRIARAASLNQSGSLTFVSGFLADRPSASSVLQGAINAALEGLARGLALELAPVRVNAVSPGMIDTPLWHGMDEAKRNRTFEAVADALPVGRVGQAQDIANAIVYLMATGFATGSTVRVDGGGAIA